MSRRECSPGSLVLARGLLNAGLPFDDVHHQGNLTLGRPALNVLFFLICHGLCHPLPPKITTLRVDLKTRGALYFALHEPEVHVGQRLHAREVLGDLPHLQSVHFSTLPAVGETNETALEWAPAGHRAGTDQYLRLGRTSLATSAVIILNPKALSATLGSRPFACPAARAVAARAVDQF